MALLAFISRKHEARNPAPPAIWIVLSTNTPSITITVNLGELQLGNIDFSHPPVAPSLFNMGE
jgi:hypothetical protein